MDNFTSAITLYTLVSFMAMTCSIGGNIFINFKNKFGFYVWIFSNFLWVLCNFMGTMNVCQVITFVVYAGCNVHGLWKWTREENEIRETNERIFNNRKAFYLAHMN